MYSIRLWLVLHKLFFLTIISTLIPHPEPYFEDGLHIWSYEARGVGDQVTKHTSALLFVPADTAVLQLR